MAHHPISFLALGDSYTVGESVPESERFVMQAVGKLKQEGIDIENPEIIARTGWTTGNLQDAMRNHNFRHPTYDLVSLLIGVNNQYQGKSLDEYEREFRGLLQRSIELSAHQPGHVIVISIPDYSVTPFAKRSDLAKSIISNQIKAFNAVNFCLSQKFGTRYLDITADTRQADQELDLIAEDGLHYSGLEYAVWARKMADLIKTLFP